MTNNKEVKYYKDSDSSNVASKVVFKSDDGVEFLTIKKGIGSVSIEKEEYEDICKKNEKNRKKKSKK